MEGFFCFNPPVDYEKLDEEFQDLGVYQIYDQFVPFPSAGIGTTNGFYSTNVIEVADKFNLRLFALLRASARCVFSGEEREKYDDLSEKYSLNNAPFFVGRLMVIHESSAMKK